MTANRRARVQRLEAQRGTSGRLRFFTQAIDGSDSYLEAGHLDVPMTRVQVDAVTEPGDIVYLLTYVDPREAATDGSKT